jgi:predicted amino acid-binding ACT domain protein
MVPDLGTSALQGDYAFTNVLELVGAKVTRAAQEAGFAKADNMFGVKVEGGDKPGLGARITRAIADAGVSFRGISAHAIGTKFISNIVVDSEEDAARAAAALKKIK